jgi:predicted Zn-dependent peptidase
MYKRATAENGLNVIASTMPGMSSVSLGIWISVGGRYESEKQSGISHFVEHMLFKGTQNRGATDLKRAIEGVGGAFNGFTSDEATCYMVKVPAEYVDLGIDVLSDMVLNAKFDPEELEKEKHVIYEEIKMYRDQPAEYVLEILARLMWPSNSLGRVLTGTEATVKAMSRSHLAGFRDLMYHPGNISVIAAGNLDFKSFSEMSFERFSKRKKGGSFSFETPSVSQKGPRVRLVRGRSEQAHIAMGFHSLEKTEKEKFAIKLMNVILGGNMSSRLFEELREKYGLCYDVASSYKRHSDLGEVHIHAGVDNRKAVKSVIAILDELKKMKDLGVTDEELDRAKKYMKGQFLLAMEGTSTRMIWLGDRFVVHKDIPDVGHVLKMIDAVECEDVKKATERIFRYEGINLAMISKIDDNDKKKIRKELSKI